MSNALLPKAALAAVAAVGLLLPFGAPLPGSCMRTIGVAGAAPAPSPSCGGDLRECLRQSADLRQTTFGGRYVTADDVAKCMEAFRSCSSGGASRGGNASPPKSTSQRAGDVANLPQRFAINGKFETATDCRIDKDAVSCTLTREETLPSGGTYSLSGEITGIASGMTITGTFNGRSTSRGDSSGCVSEQDHSYPVRYDFSPDGSVAMREGPFTVDTVFTGTCSNSPPISDTYPALDIAGTWSPK